MVTRINLVRAQRSVVLGDLACIMNWASDPRADGYSNNAATSAAWRMEYYERVGWPWFKG